MKHYSDEWIEEWCQENGWTDLFIERPDHYWAFPPNAVMPEPISKKILRIIKAEKGLTEQEKIWLTSLGVFSLLSLISSLIYRCPMPLVLAFGVGAITSVQLEIEE
jgi:hypothetical protein